MIKVAGRVQTVDENLVVLGIGEVARGAPAHERRLSEA